LKKPIQFGKYYLLDRVNVGGMAEVFKAKAFGVEGFERLLAVKRILPNIAEDEEFITMFIDEAKIAVQLNHANVCQIFDLGKVEDSYFIALEFVHGKDLRAMFDRCKQKPVDGSIAMPVAQACFVVMKACEGLDYAHNKRDGQGREMHLVHRDVSPQNILISYEGEVKLIDFGIAKAAGKMSKTQQGILKGKFGYMSPEQVRGLPLDRRSDIFSLGIVLYELLTGERLFIGESDFSTLEKVRNVEILPPSTYNRRISDELERIVMKALAKDVEDRYQNAIDLHDDLQAYMYSAGEFYSRKDLAGWMKKVWAAEIEAENAKLESYAQLPPQQPQNGAPAAAAAGGVAQPERPRRNSIPPPLPPGAGAPQRISAPMAAVASQPAVAPPTATTVPGKPQNGHTPPKVGAEADLAWDEEELATNIYDAADDDASGQIVDDKPDPEAAGADLSKLDLSLDGAPVPARPSREMPVVAPPSPQRNGSAAKHVDFVMPEAPAAPAPVQTAYAGGSFSAPVAVRPKSNAPLYATVGVAGAVVIAATVWGYVFFGNKPGEVVITSEPSVNVQVLVDNKRVADAKGKLVDGTPARLELSPGSYVLTVQREGYVPANEQVEVKAGERIAKRFVLEPLAGTGTGFTLVSEPPGLQALLDGKVLDGVTPFKVGAVSPGKHHLEVRGPNGTSWTQDVELEPGKIADVRAALTVATAVPAKPENKADAPKPAPTRTEPKASASAEPKMPKPAAPKPVADLPRLPKDETRPVAKVSKPDTRAALADDDLDEKPEPKTRVGKGADKSAAGEGYLRLGSKPWTNIAVDGKDSGLHTPQTQMKLVAGSHRITLSNPQFNIKETFSVEIKAGETATVIKDLRPQGSDSD
jgi:hypothetical protein